MKILSIIEVPYRGIIEEQDDAALWLTHADANGMDAEFDILLRGSAVNYAVRDHDPEGLVIGKLPITRPCHPDRDLTAMKDAGMTVHVVREDLEDLGVPLERVIGDFELVGRSQVADVVRQYDQIWHW